MSREQILVVDDEPRSLEAVRRTLEEDFDVFLASSVDEARRQLQTREIGVILCDQRMPGLSGVEFLKEVRQDWPDCVRIIVSGYSDSQDIIAGVNEAGLYQYLLKPWMPDHLLKVVREAAQARGMQRGIERIETDVRSAPSALRQVFQKKTGDAANAFAFEQILRTPGSPMDAACTMAERLAVHNLSVLLQGESGTGKELMARAIHYASPRLHGPFVGENCAALADTLLESELFGHKRGSFTGAYEDHVGLFQRADGGTVFLDEIGETSPLFQVKLLRVLEAREVRPVGSTRAVPVDVRVICATHRDLEAEMHAGRFREDLYYRIAESTLTLAPLRARADDVALIAQRLLDDTVNARGCPPMRWSDSAMQCLRTYSWPGNIRELRNEVGRAVALSDTSVIEADTLSLRVGGGVTARNGAHGAFDMMTLPGTGSLQDRLDAVEAVILKETLARLRWNKSQAARELGVSRVGLRAKLARHGLEQGSNSS